MTVTETAPGGPTDAGPRRVALVAGAGGGVGSAIAGALSRAGYRLALADVDANALATSVALTGTEAAFPVDLTDPSAVARMVSEVESELGSIEVLINAAGIYGERLAFADSDPDRWWQVVETNLRGPMLCCRSVLGPMIERHRGHIVNINSRAATWDDPGASSVAYSTSKAALSRFTSGLAAELVGTGVVVIDLSPGPVLTGMTATRPDLKVLSPDAFLPLSAVAGAAVGLVSGRYDELHGRFVHARDDLDDLVERVRRSPGGRRLNLALAGDDDPIA